VGRLYSTFRSNLSKKFQFWGFYTLVVAQMGVKFDTDEGLLRAKFHPHRRKVSPLRGEKPQNRPLSIYRQACAARNAAGKKLNVFGHSGGG